MTTEITVKANHGWPVQVLPLTTAGVMVGEAQVVPAGETRSFHVHSAQDLLIHEVQPARPADASEPILKYFAWAHLPERLQPVSMGFGLMAERLVAITPRCPERTVALRKLLEAKDAAVRAALEA